MRTKLFLLTFAAAAFFVLPMVAHAATNKTISTYDTVGSAQNVVVVGNYAYVADQGNGIVVLNVAVPSAPTLAATYPLTGARNLDIVGTKLYVGAGLQGLVILSIATPTAPALLGTYTESGTFSVGDVASDGTNVYVTGYHLSNMTQQVLQVIDASNAASPILITSLNISTGAEMTVSGNYVYIVGSHTLDIVNAYSVANPTLTLAGSYTDPSVSTSYQGVQVFGSIAYVNDLVSGFHAINISNPAAPTKTYDSDGRYGVGIAISNGYVFLSNNFSGGIGIYDIASTGTPVYVDSYSGPVTNFGLTVANDIAYLAEANSGLQLIDVSKPDDVAPTVVPVDDILPTLKPGDKYVDPGVTVTDNVGGTVTTVSGAVDTTKVGNNTLTYTVTDRAGNVTTVTRTVIVGPVVEKLTIKNYSYTLKVGKKNVILKPFANYRGTIVGRKLTVDKKTNPFYVFIASDAMKKPEFVMYNASGKVVTRQNLTAIGAKGLQIEIVSNPATLSVFFAIAPKAKGLTATIYNISKSGFKSLKTVTAAKGTGTLVMKWLLGYTNENVLATLVKGKTATPYVWRYNGSKKSFVRDTKFDTTKLVWTKTTVKLK